MNLDLLTKKVGGMLKSNTVLLQTIPEDSSATQKPSETQLDCNGVKIIGFKDFREIVLTMVSGLKEPASQLRIDGWIRQAYQYILDTDTDESIIKVVLRDMEDYDTEEYQLSLGVFVGLIDHYRINMCLSFQQPPWKPVFEGDPEYPEF